MRQPSEIRSVFPSNLAQLMTREASVSSFCRAVGLNRTQFNRYLSGESSPRPEVLAKICEHFSVDARILLEPLEASSGPGNAAPVANALADLIGPRPIDVSPDLLPNGFYRRWRDSISHPGQIAHMLSHVKSDGGARVFQTFARRDVASSDMRGRRIRGVLIGSADSFMIVTKFVDGAAMCHAVFEYQHHSIDRVYPGLAIFARARHPNVRRLVREVLEYVPPKLSQLREAAAYPQFCDVQDTPPHVRDILTQPLSDVQ